MAIEATRPQSDSAVLDEPAAPLTPAARATLAKWLAMLAEGDFRDLPSIIAADAVYHSPVEWHPYPGRDLVCLLVRTAAGVLEDFGYQRQFASGENAVLEFSARVGNIELKAVHILRFNGTGEIVDIDLIARPAKGVIALGNGVGSKAGPQIKAALDAAKSAPVCAEEQSGKRLPAMRFDVTSAWLWGRAGATCESRLPSSPKSQ